MNKLPTALVIVSAVGAAHAASVIMLTADEANSTPNAFGGSVVKTLDDPFSYDPSAPTSVMPNRVYNSGSIGYHANLGEGEDAVVSYSSAALITGAAESIVVVDLYGRIDLDCCRDRDDNIDVQIFNGNYDTPIATVSGLSIDNAGTGWARATFDSLPVGTAFDRFRVIGHDSGGGASNNYFTLLETRAATISPVPEPSSLGLLTLGFLALARRRRS